MEQTAELQAQIDRLSLALHQWRETQNHLQPMEQRLSHLTERCTEILNRWAATDERHAHAVSEIEERLSDWGAIERRLQEDSLQRLRELETTIEHEWKELRQLHEEPVNQLREQAAALGETCMAAANLALRGFERAEARFASLEADLQGRLTQLSHDVQAALAETRHEGSRPAPLGGTVAPFPLEGIVRIHDELREPGTVADLPAARRLRPARAEPTVALAADAAPRQLPEAVGLVDRMESLERELTSEKQELRDNATRADRSNRTSRMLLGALAGIVIVAGAFFLRFQQQVNTRLNDAAVRVVAAEQQATTATDAAARQIAATRAEAEKQISEARQSASQAQIVSNVLAAPDLVRYSLTSVDPAGRGYAQVLFSRSRGLVFSASLMPAPPAGQTYQIWITTAAAPVSIGVFVPDSAGRATVAVESPPGIRPVNVIVTVEPAGGQTAPSGTMVLSRPQQ